MYQQPLLAVRELFGRQAKAMRCVIPMDHLVSGKINGEIVNEVIIDPGSTHSLIDWDCARKLGLQVTKGANFKIEFTNGEMEKTKGVTKACHLILAQTAVDVKFCMFDAQGSYEVILGLTWLNRECKRTFGGRTVPAGGSFSEAS